MQAKNCESPRLEALRRAAAAAAADIGTEVEVDSDFVERLLGRKQGRELSRSTGMRMEKIRGEVLACIEPRLTSAVHAIESTADGRVSLTCGVDFKSRKMAHTIEGAPWLVCFVATIGPKLDRLIDRFMREGRMADAYVADTMGSGAIESVADAFHKEFAKKAANLRQSVSLRFSPGYCDWVVAEQPKLFSLLDPRAAGVELGDTSLMSPRKSISAVFAIFDKENGTQPTGEDNPCRRCGKKDCIARRVEATPPSH